MLDYDYGPAFRYNDESGVITNVPPAIKHVIPTLVPRVDKDGNEMGGMPSLLQRVPVGTYTGWNPIPTGPLKGRERSLAAGYIPFEKTKAERIASGDSRLSIEERYPTAEAYYAAAIRSANDLVQARFPLARRTPFDCSTRCLPRSMRASCCDIDGPPFQCARDHA